MISVKPDMECVFESVAGEILHFDSYFIFYKQVLFVTELFLSAFVIVYPCV